MDQPLTSEQLIEHLVIVGPGRGIPFRRGSQGESPSCSTLDSPSLSASWQRVYHPVPTILRRFSGCSQRDADFVHDVAYFCQPNGSCVTLSKSQTHVFLLTDTETNIRTYGVCLSLPHLFNPLLQASESFCELGDPDSLCIQEWGVLSICILSRHPFFAFFQHVLHSFAHFVSDFWGEDLNWNAIIRAGREDGRAPHKASSGSCGNSPRAKQSIVAELERWIDNLLSLDAPVMGQCAIEVEMEVDPAVTVSYPPSNRLPLLDLPIREVFHRLGVCMVIEVYKLVLSEQKVNDKVACLCEQ